MSRAKIQLGLPTWLNPVGEKSSPRPARRGAARQRSHAGHLSPKQVTYVLRHLSTLIENGLSLPKALATLAEERATENYREVLDGLRRRLENGESFSRALTEFPGTFDRVLVSQIKVGERAGNIAEALRHSAQQREQAGKLRSQIIGKLAYPAMLVVVGSAVIAFLLTYVVPVFQETYASAKVPLPAITEALIAVGSVARTGLPYLVGVAVVAILLLRQLRRSDDLAANMDRRLFKLPVVGSWLRDVALLQMMQVLGDLLEAGFTLAEALNEAAGAVTNQAARRSIRELQKAITRGERFSREMERHGDFFPPIVSQLVIIGEQTGQLPRSTRHIRDHLSQEIERKATMFVGAMEPILTISLASAVAAILMAIYLPMFDMINTVGK